MATLARPVQMRWSMKATEELRQRLEAKKHELEAEYHRIRAEQGDAHRQRMKDIEDKLNEVRTSLSQGIEDLTEQAAARLNRLLK